MGVDKAGSHIGIAETFYFQFIFDGKTGKSADSKDTRTLAKHSSAVDALIRCDQIIHDVKTTVPVFCHLFSPCVSGIFVR